MLTRISAAIFAASSAVAAAAPLTVPFDFSRHEIGLNVSVKGKPLYMILDTGVKPSVVDLRDAEILKLPLNRSAAGQGGGESGRAQQAIPSTIQRLSIGGRRFGDIEALATDPHDMSASYGRPLDGVLGYSFIAGNTILIDYSARMVTFYANAPAAAASLRACRMHYAVSFVSFGDEGFPVVRNFRIGKTMLPSIPANILAKLSKRPACPPPNWRDQRGFLAEPAEALRASPPRTGEGRGNQKSCRSARRPEIITGEIYHGRALVGKAGEALVAGELLRKQIDVAYPAYDGGVDLLAYREHRFGKVVPIQVKSGSERSFAFMKSWFRIPNIVLVQVWQTKEIPEYYIFGSISEVEAALGSVYVASPSWSNAADTRSPNPTTSISHECSPT